MAWLYYLLAVPILLLLLTQLFTNRSPNTTTTTTLPFPKGPKPIPYIGNLHQIPLTKPYLFFATIPSTLIGLRLGPKTRMLVLNHWIHVRNLLDTPGKSALYSDRPLFPTAQHVIPTTPDLHLVFARYGPQWRRARKTAVEFLHDEKRKGDMMQVQDAESCQLVWEFLSLQSQPREDDDTDYHRFAMRFFGAVILATVFGLRGRDSGPESKVMRFFAVQDEWAALLDRGATPPLDVFPWLRHVPDWMTPWRGWRARADALKIKQRSLYRELFEETAVRVGQGKGEGCFLERLLRAQEAARGKKDDVYSQLEMDYIGGFLMEGGADTTAMAFETFVLGVASHRGVLEQAQKEVDALYGVEQMPHVVDGTELPFLKACFLETLRWRPSFPTGMPHANTADDVYEGYSIPKGTTVVVNTWAISHNPDDFEDPDSFNPSRYLANPFGFKVTAETSDKVEKEEKEVLDSAAVEMPTEVSNQGRRQTYAFGAGRRICAGSKMAENSLMTVMAKIVWAFDVLPRDGETLDVDVRTAYKDAILTGPKLLPVKFVLRDERKRDVIKKEWEKADLFLSRFE